MREDGTMISVYDELSEKLRQDTSRGSRDGARRDLGILLFSRRDELNGLWQAVDRFLSLVPDAGIPPDLREAVETLRPLFGTRAR
jgi:hypothetical protein